ncbi:MAG: hypothetical protein RL328_1097 [Acidobacteriota bacterium]|jgi:ankyrin repeat protein
MNLPTSREEAVPMWLHLVYGHDGDHPHPKLAAEVLAQHAELLRGDLYVACATGDVDAVRNAIEAVPELAVRPIADWKCPGCEAALDRTPLIAVTHSTLVQLPEFRDGLHATARLLLAAGADPNQPHEEGGHALSALYGAAGKNQDPGMTRILLEAGADPNDGESLYHSMEEHGMECARLLLDAGARVEGSNALHHCLDQNDLDKLRLLLAHTKNVNDPGSSIGNPLMWALRRGRSMEHIQALLDAGAQAEGAYKRALLFGLTQIAALLTPEHLTIEEQFVAACARADEPRARKMLDVHPEMFTTLSDDLLKQLPNLVESGNHAAARLMVTLGWPIAVRGGDWSASALNLAVLQGNAPLTRFLLQHGASWTEEQGFGDNVHGTLCWASRNMSPHNDYVGCARALVEHGMPILELDGDYSTEVAEYLAAERARLSSR